MKRNIAILLFLLAITSPLRINAEVLGTAQYTMSFANFGYIDSMPLLLELHIKMFNLTPLDGESTGEICTIPFEAHLDSTDVDTVLVANEGVWWTERAKELLTNDHSEGIGIGCYLVWPSGGIGGFWFYDPEQEAFLLNSADFHGATITGISLRVDEISFDIIDGHIGELVDVYCRATLIVEGSWNNNVATEESSWGYIKTIPSQ